MMDDKQKIYLEQMCEILISNDRDKWCELVENGTKEQQKDFLLNKEKHCFSALFDKYISLQEKLAISMETLNDISNNSTQGGNQWRSRAIGFINKARKALEKIKEK